MFCFVIEDACKRGSLPPGPISLRGACTKESVHSFPPISLQVGMALPVSVLLSVCLLGVGCSSQRLDAVRPFDKAVDGGLSGHFQMEALTRGVVAVKVAGGVYVGWRMFGYEYDPVTPSNISYNLYRDGRKIASVTDSTNYLDVDGAVSSAYSVRAVIGGVEQEDSGNASVWAQNYLRIPLDIPPAGVHPTRLPAIPRAKAIPTTPTTVASAIWTETASTKSWSSGIPKMPATTTSRVARAMSSSTRTS